MVKTIIIFGGHIQALGLVREAAAIGIKIILFIPDGYSVARFSKYVTKTVIFRNPEQLESLLSPYMDSGALLFPTADEYIEYLDTHRDNLSRHFILGIPSSDVVSLFTDKRNTYHFAEEHGIPCPKCWYPDTLENVGSIASDLPFPVVIKPAIMYIFHQLFRKKAFLCHNKEELLEKMIIINSAGFPIKQLIVQEFLEGGAPSLYSFGVFAEKGIPRAWVTANRIRQNPMDFGNSTTFAVSCNVPEIEETSRKILLTTGYDGLAEIEFMYDAKTGQYKFLEINTRAWKWHSISNGLGFSFLSEMIKAINGQEGAFRQTDKRIAWVEHLTDLAVVTKEILKGNMSIPDISKTYRIEKTSPVLSAKDPMPAIMYLLMSPLLYLKRY